MSKLLKTASAIYKRYYIPTLNGFSHLFLLAIRIAWGWQFFESGKGKLGDIEGVTGYFRDLHIPLPKLNAILAGSTECFGGLLLMIGLGSRLISLPLAFTMLIAYLTADRAALGNLDKFVKASPFPFLMTSLIVLFFGAGFFSVDRVLKRCGCCKSENPQRSEPRA